jgi:hypothetical protein
MIKKGEIMKKLFFYALLAITLIPIQEIKASDTLSYKKICLGATNLGLSIAGFVQSLRLANNPEISNFEKLTTFGVTCAANMYLVHYAFNFLKQSELKQLWAVGWTRQDLKLIEKAFKDGLNSVQMYNALNCPNKCPKFAELLFSMTPFNTDAFNGVEKANEKEAQKIMDKQIIKIINFFIEKKCIKISDDANEHVFFDECLAQAIRTNLPQTTAHLIDLKKGKFNNLHDTQYFLETVACYGRGKDILQPLLPYLTVQDVHTVILQHHQVLKNASDEFYTALQEHFNNPELDKILKKQPASTAYSS